MNTFVTLAAATTLTLLLAACREEPDEAPPVGSSGRVAATTATTPSLPAADPARAAASAAAAVAAVRIDPAIRHADFRLAVLDARERLQVAWQACAGADRECQDRALSDYDLATAAASREYAIDATEVIDLQVPPPRDTGSAPLVQLGGSRG